jgi:hypothetical protein
MSTYLFLRTGKISPSQGKKLMLKDGSFNDKDLMEHMFVFQTKISSHNIA